MLLVLEILNDKDKYHRVDNAKGEAILINKPAREYFQDTPVLEFLEKNIIDVAANKMDLQKLSTAVNKLQATTVTLSVNPKQNSVFISEEWLRISMKPIFLNKTDIFEDNFSLQKVRKETYLFWTVENITAYKNMDSTFKNEMLSLRNFLDHLPVGLYTCNSSGNIEYINNLLAEKLNTDKNNALGCKIDDFIAYKPELLHTATGEYGDNIIFKTAKGNQTAFVIQNNVRENGELKTRGIVIWNLPNDVDLQQKVSNYLKNFYNISSYYYLFSKLDEIYNGKNYPGDKRAQHLLHIRPCGSGRGLHRKPAGSGPVPEPDRKENLSLFKRKVRAAGDKAFPGPVFRFLHTC